MSNLLNLKAVESGAPLSSPGKCDLPLIDPICEAAKTVAGKAGDVVTAPFRYVGNAAIEGVTSWVADTAQWIVGKVIGFMDTSTSPALDAAWFTERYRFMIGLAAVVLLPMLLMAVIRAVATQDVSQLLRSFFVHLPVAILGTFAAVFVTQALLTITDSFSAAVADGVAGDVSKIFDSVGSTLGSTTGGPAVPSFALFFVSLLLIIGSFMVWLELLVRSAAVTVSVFFLPVILAALVWPATSRWTRRMIETLVALILSKFVIVAVMSLATAALAEPGRGGFGSLMGGTALMTMAAFAPMALLKLLPMAETAAIGHLQGLGRKPIETVLPGSAANQAVATMRSRMASVGSRGGRATAAAATTAGVAASTTGIAAAKIPSVKKATDGRGTEKGVDTRPSASNRPSSTSKPPPKRKRS